MCTIILYTVGKNIISAPKMQNNYGAIQLSQYWTFSTVIALPTILQFQNYFKF